MDTDNKILILDNVEYPLEDKVFEFLLGQGNYVDGLEEVIVNWYRHCYEPHLTPEGVPVLTSAKKLAYMAREIIDMYEGEGIEAITEDKPPTSPT